MLLFRDWVGELSLAMQGTLATAVRGPDGCPKVDPAKDIICAYRWTIMNNAHQGVMTRDGLRAGHGDTFMGDWTGIPPSESRKAFLKSHDQYPHHWLMHLIHCAEIVGYGHPDANIRKWWRSFYEDFCDAFHMYPETREQMMERLKERTICKEMTDEQ